MEEKFKKDQILGMREFKEIVKNAVDFKRRDARPTLEQVQDLFQRPEFEEMMERPDIKQMVED